MISFAQNLGKIYSSAVNKVFNSDTVALRYTFAQSFGGYISLKRRYKLFGYVIWSSELEREDYPSWAHIQRVTLGYTEWESKLAARATIF